MNINEVKLLLNRVELLSIDCESIRNYIQLRQNKQVDDLKFNYIFETLKVTLDKGNFPAGSEPTSILIILRTLKEKLTNYSTSTQPAPDNSLRNLSNDINILGALADIKRELQSIKEKEPSVKEVITQVVHTNSESPISQEVVQQPKPKVEMQSVFVNPLIGQDLEVTGSINIEEKSQDNISDKLSKLRKLKNKSEI